MRKASSGEMTSTSMPMALARLTLRLQLFELVLRRSHAQAADMVEESQPAVKLDAVFPELHQGLRGGELRHQPGCVRGFSAGNFPFFTQDNIRPTQLCQMVGNICSDDPTPNDDNVCLIFHCYYPFDQFFSDRVNLIAITLNIFQPAREILANPFSQPPCPNVRPPIPKNHTLSSRSSPGWQPKAPIPHPT